MVCAKPNKPSVTACNFLPKSRNEGARLRVQGGKGVLAMGDTRTAALPDGTDTVIEGAARSNGEGTVTVEDTALVTEKSIPAPTGDAERSEERRVGKEWEC